MVFNVVSSTTCAPLLKDSPHGGGTPNVGRVAWMPAFAAGAGFAPGPEEIKKIKI
jgi:hypothetical protein